MNFYVTVSKHPSKLKMAEIVSEYLYQTYHRSVITETQLKGITAEIERVMNNAIVKNSRLKMLEITEIGRDDDGRPVSIDNCHMEGSLFNINVSGGSWGQLQSSVKLYAQIIIVDYTVTEEGGES